MTQTGSLTPTGTLTPTGAPTSAGAPTPAGVSSPAEAPTPAEDPTPAEPLAPTGRAAKNRRESGFTLLEILVVIAILGLLIGLVAPAVLHQLGNARGSVAKQSLERLGTVLDMYKLDVGSYPTSEEGLHALVEKPGDTDNWNGPYIKGAEPKDAWNHSYFYRAPSERADHDYDLCSRGANNATGDSSAEGMICNP